MHFKHVISKSYAIFLKSGTHFITHYNNNGNQKSFNLSSAPKDGNWAYNPYMFNFSGVQAAFTALKEIAPIDVIISKDNLQIDSLLEKQDLLDNLAIVEVKNETKIVYNAILNKSKMAACAKEEALKTLVSQRLTNIAQTMNTLSPTKLKKLQAALS